VNLYSVDHVWQGSRGKRTDYRLCIYYGVDVDGISMAMYGSATVHYCHHKDDVL